MSTLNAIISDTVTARENVFMTQPSQGLTVRDVINDLLLLWGIAIPSTAPDYMLTRAIHDMNAAFQMIWAMAKDSDYFTRQTLTLSFLAGVATSTLPSNVLALLGPLRFASNGQPLRPVSTRAQFDAYGPLFLNSLSYVVPDGVPQAFFLEKLNVPEPDNVENIIHIVPAPLALTTLLLGVSVGPPRYVWNDYMLSTPVEFPQKYADSVLLPFCRYKAMTSYLVPNPDIRPQLQSDYQSALQIIGAIDSDMKEVEMAEGGS